MENVFGTKLEYYDSPEKVKYKYCCGLKCAAVRYMSGDTPITDKGQITHRYPLKEDSSGVGELYYAGYEVRCGADDVIPYVPEHWIQLEEPSELTPINSKLVL